MAQQEGDKPEEKFEFTRAGEALGYIGLDQARVRAIEHARDHPDFYGTQYQGVRFVWEMLSAQETEDYYEVRLSFRPAGRYRGEPGVEQLIFDKTGELRVRQLLDEPAPSPGQPTVGPIAAAGPPPQPAPPTPSTEAGAGGPPPQPEAPASPLPARGLPSRALVSSLSGLPTAVQIEVTRLLPDRQAQFIKEYRRKRKSVGLAYLLWLFGLHYGYLGRWRHTALLILMSWLLIGLLWWVVDLFRLPRLVGKHNQNAALDLLASLR